MPENFRIRIRKDGRLYFYSQELGEERMRGLREMLEDCLGQVLEVRPDEGGELPPPGVALHEDEAGRERLELGESEESD